MDRFGRERTQSRVAWLRVHYINAPLDGVRVCQFEVVHCAWRWLETQMKVASRRYLIRVQANILRWPHDFLLFARLLVDLLIDESAFELGCIAVSQVAALVLLVNQVESRHDQIVLLLVVVLAWKSTHHVLAWRHQSIATVVKMSVL